MLHSEYITSCFMAKSVIWHDFQGSSHKQEGQTFHCFVQVVIFFQPSVWKYVLFVCFKYRLFLAFQTLWLEIPSPHSWSIVGKSCLPPTQQFLRTRIKIIFRGRCKPQRLKSAKNKLHAFRQKPRKFGDAKISHYTVFQKFLIKWNTFSQGHFAQQFVMPARFHCVPLKSHR